jgi:predicted O-methyltransferase YrrM
MATLYGKVTFNKALDDFREKEEEYSSSLDKLIYFVQNWKYGYFSLGLLQNHQEIKELLQIIEKQKTRHMMEIGTFRGGTLFLFSKVINVMGSILSVDYPETGNLEKQQLWTDFLGGIIEQVFYTKIDGDSHSYDTIRTVKETLRHPLDFLFIDGDHTYEGAKQDYISYMPFVKKGGMIVFHDINPREESKEQLGSVKLWQELRESNMRTKEIIAGDSRGMGIGILYKS